MVLKSKYIEEINDPQDRDMGIIFSVLESGNSVELPAVGYSMFPTLQPGDIVVMKSLANRELPIPGTIIILKDDHRLIMHRLLSIKNVYNNTMVITRGDSMPKEDDPWNPNNILGFATSFKRCGKRYSLKCSNPAKWRYRYNRILVVLYSKIKKLKHVTGLFFIF